MGSKERMVKNRNYDSIKCKCGNRISFNAKEDVETNDIGQRTVHCNKCNKEIVLRKK